MIRSSARAPRAAALAAVVVSIFAFTAPPAAAGPLDPPAGPITSTHKTLTEVEPRTPISAATTPGGPTSTFRISQPGSYYLTGNVTGVSARHGILIDASNVTLDLNGFALLGVPGSFSGINAGGHTGLVVRNGTVSGWGSAGVELFSAGSTLIEGVAALNNGTHGIRAGTQSVVRFCIARENGSYGIIAFTGGVIESCTAYLNSFNGFGLGDASVIRSCVARDNAGNGIEAFAAAVVVDCSAFSNDGVGIIATSGSTIERCTVRSNVGDGILVAGSGCIIRGNTCTANGTASVAAGIRVNGSDCRIEDNVCTTNDIGIDVNSGGNIIVRNTCSGNTTNNWDIVAGNVCLVINANTAGAITGNSGGTAPGSTDPRANFTY